MCHSHFGNGDRNGILKLHTYVLHYRLWTNITWRFLLKSSKIYRRSRVEWKNIGKPEINIIIGATINRKTLSSYLMRPKITFLVAYRKWNVPLSIVRDNYGLVLMPFWRMTLEHWICIGFWLKVCTFLCEEKNCHPKELIYDLCTNLYPHYISYF